MSDTHDRVRSFLHAELLHSLGAYRLANEALEAIAHGDDWLGQLIGVMTSCNDQLHGQLHRASSEARHPPPRLLPWSPERTFAHGATGKPACREPADDCMVAYYEAAIAALRDRRDSVPPDASLLARWLTFPRDGTTRRSTGATDLLIERYRRRLDDARDVVMVVPADNAPAPTVTAAHLGSPVTTFVLTAFVEGHVLLHGVESLQSLSLADHLERDRAAAASALRRSRVLLTFAYSISRTCPWIFASGPDEARWVLESPERCWSQMVPSACLWPATQVSLLALHRRAYGRALEEGEDEAAYRDYSKLQRQLRHTDRRLHQAPAAPRGASEFVTALDAIADHHIGELYRASHAHTAALTHLARAHGRMERLRNRSDAGSAVPEALGTSRWRIELYLSNGKARYELGQPKASLGWYIKAWKAVLEVQAEDEQTELNAVPIDAAIAWLDATEHEPILYKNDVDRHVRPIAAQLDAILVDERLESLAAEVLTRLGHLLFVLRVDDETAWARWRDSDEPLPILQFLQKAAECDPANTTLGSDLLKLAYRVIEDGTVTENDLARLRPNVIVPIQRQWQSGGDDFARLSRATEYVLLQELLSSAGKRPASDPAAQMRGIARRLLAGVFMHTDSINVRRSQVHERLGRKRKAFDGSLLFEPPVIELVSMRRFSSAFPLLPRPAAFRSLAGGYFLRILAPGREPYGIAIDPGTDFVETLFRTGFSIADIQMIVVTHDHVDHMSALEPLLSLLHERSQVQGRPQPPLPLVGNRGVLDRHRRTRRYSQLQLYDLAQDPHSWSPEEWLDAGKEPPRPLRELNARLSRELGAVVELTAVSSAAIASPAHRDNSNEPSHGFALRVGGENGPSVAVTSDMPRPDGAWPWRDAMAPLLACDVLVAHLSSLPVAELRQAAGLGDRGATAKQRELTDRKWLLDFVQKAAGISPGDEHSLASRLDYAYWLDRHRVDLVGPGRLSGWTWSPTHLYLGGLLDVARAYRAARPDGLFVIGELSEELGSLRGKVAYWISDGLDHGPDWKALTADIGLDVLIGRPAGSSGSPPVVRIRCDTCQLDNDLADPERYHAPKRLHEVCVKGENEGIFYNCTAHDPGRQDPPTFVERFERYDVFGR